MDPWVWAITEELDAGTFTVKQPQEYVLSEGFTPEVQKVFGYDSIEYLKKLHDTCESHKKELIIIKDTNHFHQCDAIALVPMESALRSINTFQLNYLDLYLLHS